MKDDFSIDYIRRPITYQSDGQTLQKPLSTPVGACKAGLLLPVAR